jgi:hypothetical protein
VDFSSKNLLSLFVMDRLPQHLAFNVDLRLFPTESSAHLLFQVPEKTTKEPIHVFRQSGETRFITRARIPSTGVNLILPLADSVQVLGMLVQCGSLLWAYMSRTPFVDPSADPLGTAHKQCIGFEAFHDILHVNVDIARQVVFEERADIRVLHD